ncbi:MAG: glycine--tRNA ligase [Candidatus Paceibacterota bacterium]
MSEAITMEKLISLCKRRGFIFPGSELYGGLAGMWDYGPLGVELKNNIRDMWWKSFVHDRRDMYGLDSAILMKQDIWKASGHVGGFVDPIVEDTVTKERHRADHLLEKAGLENADNMSPEEMTEYIKENDIKSPAGNPLSEVKTFNLMFQTTIGATGGEDAVSYLRPETAQGIFVNYKNVLDTFYPSLPFGIAQIGKAFRNEISPRDFIFRIRELEQMEIEYFINEKDWQESFDYWRKQILKFYDKVGVPQDMIYEHEIPAEGRAHYSKRTIDFEFYYPFGLKELTGLAYRTNYDLSKHQEHSGTSLEYTDKHTGEKFIPHVIEPSFGVERLVLAVLVSAYREDQMDGETRTYLALKPELAPVRVAVFPLLKNKPELVKKAEELYLSLKKEFGRVWFDDHGNIGKRYRRQDEIGTPQCVTVDFDTLEDGSVTVRDRDTGKQERVLISELPSFLRERKE